MTTETNQKGSSLKQRKGRKQKNCIIINFVQQQKKQGKTPIRQ